MVVADGGRSYQTDAVPSTDAAGVSKGRT
jgi:hypothetical protein